MPDVVSGYQCAITGCTNFAGESKYCSDCAESSITAEGHEEAEGY